MSALPPLPSLPTLADPANAAFDNFKLAVAEQLSKSLEIPLEQAYQGIESGKTGKGVYGDFQVAIPRFKLKGDPKKWAEKVVAESKPDAWISLCEARGAFVSFTCETSTLTRMILEQINTFTYLRPQPTASTSTAPSPSPAAAAAATSSSSASTTAKTSDKEPSLDSLSLSSAPSSAETIRKPSTGYGTNTSGAGKNIVIEFSSPNIAKPFHAGHLRSTIIGAFLANLYEANGWSVQRINYLGDWGKQFGILAVGFAKYGSEAQLKEDAITHLYNVYVKINADGEKDPSVHERAREFFVGMENGDAEALALWGKFRDLSIAKYKDTYARLNIHFDDYSGESQVSHAYQTQALDTLKSAGIVQESDGALIVNLDEYKMGKTVVRKKDGTYVYITRDIGGAIQRWEKYQFDKMIYVVASQQDLHLAQFFKVLELMKYPWADRLQHVNFGMVTGMSTRKGTAVFLDQILNESKEVMHEQMKKNEAKYANLDDPLKTSDKLGITAVKIQDMSAKRIGNYDFKWERMTSFEGDTGPYLQYAHVRLSSVERKNAPALVLPSPAERATTIDTTLLTEPHARAIIALLAIYPEVVKTALKSLEPSTICTWCFRLSHAVSSAWEVLLVLNQPREVAMARLWLYVSARDVLGQAMSLLTLEPQEKM